MTERRPGHANSYPRLGWCLNSGLSNSGILDLGFWGSRRAPEECWLYLVSLEAESRRLQEAIGCSAVMIGSFGLNNII